MRYMSADAGGNSACREDLTMKKISIKSVAVLLICAFLLGTSAEVYAQCGAAADAGNAGYEAETQMLIATGRMNAAPVQMDMGLFHGEACDAEELVKAKKSCGTLPDGMLDASKASAVYSDNWDAYSSNFYYNQMNADQKEFWDALDALCLSYLKKKKTMTSYLGYYVTNYVYSRQLSLDEAIEVAQIFRYSNPQYYYLEPLVLYATTQYRAGVSFVVYDAFGKGSDRAAATKAFKAKIESWVSMLDGYGSDYDKAKAAHDIVCANTTYNYGVLDATGAVDAFAEQEALTQSAYSALCMGSTVCAGYAQAYEMLCNGAGVDAAVVTSANHEWNKVRMNDSWYNVDCTWDDQESACYDFFARSDYAYDNVLTNAGSHVEESRWDTYMPKCTLDSGSSGATAGTLPTVTGTTEHVQIQVENTYKHDKTSDEDYVSGYKITLSTTTPDAVIYYTTDGTVPSPASTRSCRYSKPFQISYADKLMAIAVCDQQYDSEITADESCPALDYAIHYKLNGGENSADNPNSYKTTDKTIKLKNPTRTGYKFGGWYETKKFNSSRIRKIESGSQGAICLYAKWTPVTYKIKFDGNGATSGSMRAKKCRYGTGYTLSSNKFKRSGYVFAGWSTKKNGKGTTYADKEKVRNLTDESKGTVVLYAQWKKK